MDEVFNIKPLTKEEVAGIFMASGIPDRIVANMAITPDDWFEFANAVAVEQTKKDLRAFMGIIMLNIVKRKD